MKSSKLLSAIVLTVIFIIGGLNIFAAPVTPDPGKVIEPIEIATSVIIPCTQGVYVDAGAPTSNMNAFDYNYIRVGKGTEFLYEREGLLLFDNIAESQGGLLPEGAEITKAVVRLYKNDEETGTINIRQLTSDFTESTVTWQTKPGVGGIIGSKDLADYDGWHEIEIPVSVVNNWIASPSSNHGISLTHSWSGGFEMSFGSDENKAYRPGLRLNYTGADEVETEEPSVPSDSVACSMSYTVSPESPAPGELVTITVTATDNVALSHVSIMRGYTELARNEATTDDTTSLTVAYSEIAELPSMSYTLMADDIGAPEGIREDITVPVAGSGSGPAVDVDIEWLDVTEVLPEEFRLITEDGQRARITATATDADGIETLSISINGLIHDFDFTGQTSVSRSILWENTDASDTTFSYFAAARDRENIYSSTDPVYIDIAQRMIFG